MFPAPGLAGSGKHLKLERRCILLVSQLSISFACQAQGSVANPSTANEAQATNVLF